MLIEEFLIVEIFRKDAIFFFFWRCTYHVQFCQCSIFKLLFQSNVGFFNFITLEVNYVNVIDVGDKYVLFLDNNVVNLFLVHVYAFRTYYGEFRLWLFEDMSVHAYISPRTYRIYYLLKLNILSCTY